MKNKEIDEVIDWLKTFGDDAFFAGEHPTSIELERSYLFMEKYWLTQSEYAQYWEACRHAIFPAGLNLLPDYVFNSNLSLIGINGTGCTFYEEEYRSYQNYLRKIGEKFFIIISNDDDGITLRFKFPVDISYEELNSGETISKILIAARYPKDYYIFGETKLWGKYSATVSFDCYFIAFNESIKKDAVESYKDFLKENQEFKDEIASAILKPRGYYDLLGKYLENMI